jgi:glycolate oxidase FAD binding subunit
MSAPAEAPPGLDALRAELGALVTDPRPPIVVAGRELHASVEPDSGEALGATVGALHRARIAAIVRGGGTRIGQGNPARDASVLLSTRGLSGIDELDADDGVVHAGAGTPLAELARAAADAGWALPLDVPDARATLGGALASAAAGPRALGFGPPRDAVLGLEVALATGERTRCGGRVVKNVTGYDMAKLYVGSMGSLGVIEAAWLRLRAQPRAQRVHVAALPADGFALALEAARRGTASATALLDPSLAMREDRLAARIGSADGWVLVAELAGDPAACAADAEWLANRCALEPDDATLIDRVGSLQATSPESTHLHARLHVLPSELAAAANALRAGGASVLAYPVPGVVHAWLSAPDELEDQADDVPQRADWLSGALARIEAVRAAHRGTLFLEALPEWPCAAAHDVFGDPGPALAIMRALKQRFDPGGVLNPGRFAGRL